MPLSRQSVGTYREKISHAPSQGTLGPSRLGEPLWTDSGIKKKSGLCVRVLISI